LALVGVGLVLSACLVFPPATPPESFVPLPTAAGPGPTCENATGGYSLIFSQGWWVHPDDRSREIEPCAYFGPDPFDLTVNEHGVLTGWQVRVWVVAETGCVGYTYEDQFLLRQDVMVGGYPARRERIDDGFGDERYQYVVNLVPDLPEDECESGRVAFVDTRRSGAVDYDLNRDAVDQIAATILFTP
jgi:hypothetical protein